MPNGKPIRTDLELLRVYRDVPEPNSYTHRAEVLGIEPYQFRTLASKDRFSRFIEYSWNIELGWLTEEGKQKLIELEQK